MARTKTQKSAPTGTQTGGGTIIYREQAIQGLGASIQALETEAQFQRGMLTQLAGKAGTAGGLRAGKSDNGGTGGDGGEVVSNPVWIAQLLQQNAKGLTAAQIREYAQQAGRTVHASFPHDSFGKMREAGRIRKHGTGTGARYTLTNRGITWMAKAGTANLPPVGRQKKTVAKTMAAG